jgi:hypothetical protein
MGQADPCGSGLVHQIYILLFIYSHKESHKELCFFLNNMSVHKKLCLFYKVLCVFLNSYDYLSCTFFRISVTLSINRVFPQSFKKVCYFELVIFYDFESLISKSQEKERDTSYVRWAQGLLVLLLYAVDHCILGDMRPWISNHH